MILERMAVKCPEKQAQYVNKISLCNDRINNLDVLKRKFPCP